MRWETGLKGPCKGSGSHLERMCRLELALDLQRLPLLGEGPRGTPVLHVGSPALASAQTQHVCLALAAAGLLGWGERFVWELGHTGAWTEAWGWVPSGRREMQPDAGPLRREPQWGPNTCGEARGGWDREDRTERRPSNRTSPWDTTVPHFSTITPQYSSFWDESNGPHSFWVLPGWEDVEAGSWCPTCPSGAWDGRKGFGDPVSCPSPLSSSFMLQLIWVDPSIPESCGASEGPASEDSVATETWWLPEDSCVCWVVRSIFGFRMWAVI